MASAATCTFAARFALLCADVSPSRSRHLVSAPKVHCTAACHLYSCAVRTWDRNLVTYVRCVGLICTKLLLQIQPLNVLACVCISLTHLSVCSGVIFIACDFRVPSSFPSSA